MERVSGGDAVGLEAVLIEGGEAGEGGDGAAAGLYFMGDSFERKSRREGSRSRRGSVEEDEGEVLFPNQPIMK